MPTEKQKRAAELTIENRRNPMGKNLREAGYSEAVATHPKMVTESDGWKEIMKEYFPDRYMAEKHKRLFEREEILIKNNNKTGKIEVVKTGEIDVNAVKAALDMGYKLTGKYVTPDQNVLVETLEQRLKRKKLENEKS